MLHFAGGKPKLPHSLCETVAHWLPGLPGVEGLSENRARNLERGTLLPLGVDEGLEARKRFVTIGPG